MLRPPFSNQLINQNNWDVVVIGAGAAGLMTCLELPDNLNILLLNRNTSKKSSSRWAQGGIASVVRPEDSFDLHAKDTLKAGDGLCDPKAVEMLVKEAPSCVASLQKLGMTFDMQSDQLSTSLISNIAGALKVDILGHSKSISNSNFYNVLQHLLK